MKKLLVCGAALALLVPAAPAAAAKKLDSCRENQLTPLINNLQKRKLRCSNARTVVTTVEQQSHNCRPYRDEPDAATPRECRIVAVLTTGEREFTCTSAWEALGEDKRWWRTNCRSTFGDVVTWRRDGDALPQ